MSQENETFLTRRLSSALAIARLGRFGGSEHEYLDGEVGVDVVLAHEGGDLALELAFDDCDQVVAHRELIVVAKLQNPIGATVVDERALAFGKRVRKHDGYDVVVDQGLCLRWSSAGVLVQQPYRGGGDHGGGSVPIR